MEKDNFVNCRLCLVGIHDSDVTLLDGIIKDMLEIILPELNLSICNPSSICNTCLSNLKQSYSFKSACLEVEDKLQGFVDPNKSKIVDLKEVIKKNNNIKDTMAANLVVCRICLNLGNELEYTKLCSYEGDPLQNMVEKCLPEMGLTLSKDPSICQMCLEQLEEQFHFIMQCLDTEGKITYYSEKKLISQNIDLHKVYVFSTCMEVTELEKSLDALIDLTESSSKMDNNSHLPKNINQKEEVRFELKKDVNGEDIITSQTSVIVPDDSDSDISVTRNSDLLILKKVVRPQRKKKPSINLKEVNHSKPKYREDPGDISEEEFNKQRGRLRKCKSCDFKTKFSSRLKAHMTVNHSSKAKTTQEKILHKCRICTFQTVEFQEYINHKEVHKKEREQKCPHCNLTFVRLDFLKKHIESHSSKRPPSTTYINNKKKLIKKSITSPNVTMSKPNMRNTISINGKLLKMFKCQLCPYQTRLKSNHDRHALTHKKSSEIKIHKCKICNFETIQKENYLVHMHGHENESEKIMKCFLCSFQPSSKESLKQHVSKVHKSGTG